MFLTVLYERCLSYETVQNFSSIYLVYSCCWSQLKEALPGDA